MTINISLQIAPTTEAITTSAFALSQDPSSLSIIANGFGGGEYARVQIWDNTQNAWYDLMVAGDTFQLDEDNNVLSLSANWLQYRLQKTITTLPVGITVRQYNASGNTATA